MTHQAHITAQAKSITQGSTMTKAHDFKFIRKWNELGANLQGEPCVRTFCEYEASFWEGPTAAGGKGQYARKVCRDEIFGRIDGRQWDVFLHTSPGVSYFSALLKACGLRGR